jgi:hypothetical protein
MPPEDKDATGLPVLRDIDGAPIPFRARVEQIVADEEHGALPSRLHAQGQAIGRGTHHIYVRFDRDREMIALRPEFVRVISTPDPPTTPTPLTRGARRRLFWYQRSTRDPADAHLAEEMPPGAKTVRSLCGETFWPSIVFNVHDPDPRVCTVCQAEQRKLS